MDSEFSIRCPDVILPGYPTDSDIIKLVLYLNVHTTTSSANYNATKSKETRNKILGRENILA